MSLTCFSALAPMVIHMHQSGAGENDPSGQISVDKCKLCTYIPL